MMVISQPPKKKEKVIWGWCWQTKKIGNSRTNKEN